MTEGTLEQTSQSEKTKSQDKVLLENKADLVRLFELFIKIDRRVNLTGSYETQSNRSPNNTN